MKSVQSVRAWDSGTGIRTYGHMPLGMLVQSGLIEVGHIERSYRFAVVRNPFDRAISLYEYLKLIGRLSADTSFAAFAKLLSDGQVEPVGLYNSWGISQANPQSSWLFSDSGYCFANCVLRLEEPGQIEETLARVSGSAVLKHRNRSTRQTVETYYQDDTIARIIRNYYAVDFDRFGYSDDVGDWVRGLD